LQKRSETKEPIPFAGRHTRWPRNSSAKISKQQATLTKWITMESVSSSMNLFAGKSTLIHHFSIKPTSFWTIWRWSRRQDHSRHWGRTYRSTSILTPAPRPHKETPECASIYQ
jgi:hypothetical protein